MLTATAFYPGIDTPGDMKRFYDAQGYLLLPDLLNAAEVVALRSATDAVLEGSDGLSQSTGKFAIAPGADGRHHVRRIFDPIAHHQAFRDVVFHPRILDVLESLIGPDIQLHHSKLNLKPPSTPDARFEWHQDYPFFPHTNYDLVAVLIHIDDATLDNGALRIIPGSHKAGPLPHRFAADGAFSSTLLDQTVVADDAGWLWLPARAGSVELHHCNMLHSSSANTGEKPRRALVLQYRAADNVALAGRTGAPGFRNDGARKQSVSRPHAGRVNRAPSR